MTIFHVAPLPAAGHVNPMLPVAAELVRRGEQVHVWLPASYGVAVRATGARHRETPEMEDPGPGTGRPRLRDARRLARTIPRLTAVLRRPPEGLLGELGPDTLLVHDLMATWGRRIGTPRVAFSCSAVTDAATLTAGLARRVARALRADPDRVRERLLRSPLPRLLGRLPVVLDPAGVPTVVAVPPVLQPDPDRFAPDVTFVGPCLEPRATESGDPLLDALDGERRPVLLVALGSTFNHRPEFYRECFAAFRGQPWRVVMAIGRYTDPAELGTPPDNVTLAATVPQLALLDRAAAFVSHAGMGSVQESLHAGVPLVLFPQMPEQRENARHVVEAGAGVLLGREPGATEIRAAVARALADPAIAAAVAALRGAARDAGGRSRAADVLQEAAGRRVRPAAV